MSETRESYEGRIRMLVEPVLEADGMELVLAECLVMKSRWIVRLYIDKPGGVTIDDCASVSHLLGDVLDVNDILPVPYTLEISSPGINRPLVRDKDFLQYLGCRVAIRTLEKIEGVRNFKGNLVDYVVGENSKVLRIEMGRNVFSIPREVVASAHLEGDIKI